MAISRAVSFSGRRARVGRASVLTALLMGAITTGVVEAQAPDTGAIADGARLEEKLLRIVDQAQTAASAPRLTPLLEPEINAYLVHQGVDQLPTGLTEPTIQIADGGLVFVEAVIDLDRIREQRTRSWLDPLQYLTGQLGVAASGHVRAANGLARVELASVAIGGIPLPLSVLEELVQFYTRTTAQPNGTDLDEPIPLPYGITELRLSPGLAVIVQ